MDNIAIYSPQYLNKINYDYVLIGSSFESDIYKQLINEIGLDEKKIISNLNEIEDGITHDIFDYNKLFSHIVQKAEVNNKLLVENSYRNKFKDTIIGLDWWRNNTSISAGDWAVGYNYLYYMVRILNNFKPKAILELGLGQSSKAICNYYDYYCKLNKINYEIIEQDAEWIEFFKNENKINENIKVHLLPLDNKYVKEYNAYVNVYSNFKNEIQDKKYNLISIDGPWGSEAISRIDILECIPECLETSFVIMFDDYQRFGEKNMISELKKILTRNNILYECSVKRGMNDIYIITSKDLKFLCTM